MGTEQANAAPAAEKVILSKMNPRNMGVKPVSNEEPTALCAIYGSSDGFKTGEDATTGRVWVALAGSFEGVNYANGKVYRSGKLFLPAGIHEIVEAAVRKIVDSGEKGLTVKFALELRSVAAKNPAGYTWQAVNIMPIQATDELDGLRQAIRDAGRARLGEGSEPAPAQLPAPPAAEKQEAPKPAAKKAHK